MHVDSEPLPLAPLSEALSTPVDIDPAAASQPFVARLRARLLNVLPVLAMGALAAATWWLVQHAPRPQAVTPAPTLGHVPDYEMRGFSIRHQGRSGLAAALIEGERVRHFADVDTLEIEGLRLRWSDPTGRLTEAVADRAVMKAEGAEIVLEGHARVTRAASTLGREARGGEQPRLDFRSEWMSIDTHRDRVQTDRPVRLTYGASQFDAGGLRYDHSNEDLELDGPVRGHLAPVRQ
ncbi:MAG: export transporter periplasmic protein LptC [Pseudomonadota bacterium]|jgi:lipopolysaccharide export system protein LptC